MRRASCPHVFCPEYPSRDFDTVCPSLNSCAFGGTNWLRNEPPSDVEVPELNESPTYGSTVINDFQRVRHGMAFMASAIMEFVRALYDGRAEGATFQRGDRSTGREAARRRPGGEASRIVFFIRPLLRCMQVVGGPVQHATVANSQILGAPLRGADTCFTRAVESWHAHRREECPPHENPCSSKG